MWQDVVLMIVGFFFLVALFPSLFSEAKPHWGSSLLTSLLLGISVVCYATLDLWLAAWATGSTLVGWVILLVQSLRSE